MEMRAVSDTPRTDALLAKWHGEWGADALLTLTRQLERELNAARPEERAHKCKARETIEYAITLLEVHGGNPKVIEYLRAGLDQHEAAPPMNSGRDS
jgi:hypothetical protein